MLHSVDDRPAVQFFLRPWDSEEHGVRDSFLSLIVGVLTIGLVHAAVFLCNYQWCLQRYQSSTDRKIGSVAAQQFNFVVPEVNQEAIDAFLRDPSLKAEADFITASWNIGSYNDWKVLYLRTRVENWQEGTLKVDEDMEKIAKEDQFEQNVRRHHDACVRNQFDSLLREQKPSVISLQEYKQGDGEYDNIRELLDQHGYAIYGEDDMAVAVKREDFDVLQAGTLFDPLDSSLVQVTTGLAPVFVDLRHKKSNACIRVVSDHVIGFSIKERKDLVSKRGGVKEDISEEFDKRLASNLAKYEQELEYPAEHRHAGVAQGDLLLDVALQNVSRQVNGVEPHLIVYGLDANATVKDAQDKMQRAHPKRMRQFTREGFVVGANEAPTMLDGWDHIARTIDYLCYKQVPNCQLSVQPVSTAINDARLLSDPNTQMSDHLPVINRVVFKSE